MKKREMKITIGKDGQVNIEVQGVGGPDCLEFSRFLEEELGEVKSRQKTAEYYEEEQEDRLQLNIGEE
jgi:hypothetical protein